MTRRRRALLIWAIVVSLAVCATLLLWPRGSSAPTLSLIWAIVVSLAVSATLVLWLRGSSARTLSTKQILSLPYETIEGDITSQHPSAYIIYAARVFCQKTKDEGVFWFYVGQLRYRFHLAANPDLEPSGDPALFASLQFTVGESINRFAGSNPDQWIETIDKALAWDSANPNGFTSKSEHQQEYQETRKGLEDLKAHIAENRQELLDRDRMPKEWPALVDLPSVEDLEGEYSTESFHLLAVWLFDQALTPEIRGETDVVRIERVSESSIHVIAIADGEEIDRRLVRLDEADDGYSFTSTEQADALRLCEGGSTKVITLFRNTEGDLVLKWVFTISGKKTRDGLYSEETSVSWERAAQAKSPSRTVDPPPEIAP